jgi:CubicO group peptidase (beta-lactamase class C family)
MEGPALESLGERIGALLSNVRKQTGVPGIGVAVSFAGRRLLVAAGTRAPGGAPLDEKAGFHLGCTTKLLLAVVVLELARAGRIDLDAALAEYLPELARTRQGESVQVRHLLSHTSGYRGTNIFDRRTRELTWPRLVAYLRDAPQFFPPGRVFSYEHTESALLGRIVERATGRTSLELVREAVLDPLGIEPSRVGGSGSGPRCAGRNELDVQTGRCVALDSAPALSDFWHPAFSDYAASLGELVKIADALLGIDAPGRADIVSPDARRRLLRRVVQLPPALGGPAREVLPVGFGLGAAELPGGWYGHNGLSYGQCLGLRFDPVSRTSLAVGVNVALPYLRDFVIAAVIRHVTGLASEEPGRPSVEIDLADLPGLYLGPGDGALSVSMREERLVLEIGPEGKKRTVIGELAADDARGLVLRSPIPQLSLGLFRAPGDGEPGIMLGLNAYKRVAAG